MDIFTTRRQRLRLLIDEDFGGNQAAFSRCVEIKPSQVNRWLSTSALKIPKIFEESARDIEQKCNKPPGWLDTESPMPMLSPQAVKLAEIISSLPDVQQAAIINLVESTIEIQRQANMVVQTTSTADHQEK